MPTFLESDVVAAILLLSLAFINCTLKAFLQVSLEMDSNLTLTVLEAVVLVPVFPLTLTVAGLRFAANCGVGVYVL